MEKEKQDDALSDLSNILGDLKGMASEMGSELDRCSFYIKPVSIDIFAWSDPVLIFSVTLPVTLI